jgi:hypothetical protein
VTSHAIVFWAAVGEKISCFIPNLSLNGPCLQYHDTIAGAAEAIQMLHMGPMIDVQMCNQLLQAH